MDHASSSTSSSSNDLVRSLSTLSNFKHSPILNRPATPIRLFGIPFKWESHPGVPKPYLLKPKHKEIITKRQILLPPPPPTSYLGAVNSKKKPAGDQAKWVDVDPFSAALAACSTSAQPEEEQWKSTTKVGRTLSGRCGFIVLYGSCKNVATAVEPTVHIHRSGQFAHSMTSQRLR